MTTHRSSMRDFFFPSNSPIRQIFDSIFPDGGATRQFENALAQVDIEVQPNEPIEAETGQSEVLPDDPIPNGFSKWQEEEHQLFLETTANEWLKIYATGIYIEPNDRTAQSLERYRVQQNLGSIEDALLHWVSQLPEEIQKLSMRDEQWGTLTDREKEVAALYCLGLEQLEIVDVLPDITSMATIKTHLTNARGKFGLKRIEHLRYILGNKDFSEYDRNYKK